MLLSHLSRLLSASKLLLSSNGFKLVGVDSNISLM